MRNFDLKTFDQLRGDKAIIIIIMINISKYFSIPKNERKPDDYS